VNGGASHQTKAPVFVLSGKASDNRSVDRVEMQAGKGRFVQVAGTPSRWFQVARLQPGKNVFSFRAIDTSGNISAIKRVTITFAH
jgi:hypothetical protein